MPKINSFKRVSVGDIITDGVAAVAATFDTSPWQNASFLVTIRVNARQTDDATVVAGFITSALFSTDDGTLSLIGSAVDQFSEGEAWTVTLTAVGDNITVTVDGTAVSIKWLVDMDVQVNDEAPVGI